MSETDGAGAKTPMPRASRLKFDLDLASEAVDRTSLTAELTYPEWDYTRKAYLPAHCRVLARVAEETGESWEADEEARRRICRVRRQFEALRPHNEVLRAPTHGEELDIEKEALLVLARGSAACGDDHAIMTFTSRRPTAA